MYLFTVTIYEGLKQALNKGINLDLMSIIPNVQPRHPNHGNIRCIVIRDIINITITHNIKCYKPFCTYTI